jgi:hypothetical protein
MRALVGGLGFMPVLPGSAVLPGPVLQLVAPWSSCDDLGTMAGSIGAGVPSASE